MNELRRIYNGMNAVHFPWIYIIATNKLYLFPKFKNKEGIQSMI